MQTVRPSSPGREKLPAHPVQLRKAFPAIASRLAELRIGPKNLEEQRALLDACSTLLVIQRPKLILSVGKRNSR